MTKRSELPVCVERAGLRVHCTPDQLPTVLAHLSRTAATAKPRPPARAAKPKPARRRSSQPRQSRSHKVVFQRLPSEPLTAAEARLIASGRST